MGRAVTLTGRDARGRAFVLEPGARYRDELPAISARAQRQLQHAIRTVTVHLAVAGDPAKLVHTTAAGAGDELPDAVLGIGFPLVVLRREPFVDVIVPVEHDIRAGLVED